MQTHVEGEEKPRSGKQVGGGEGLYPADLFINISGRVFPKGSLGILSLSLISFFWLQFHSNSK